MLNEQFSFCEAMKDEQQHIYRVKYLSRYKGGVSVV